MSLMLVLVFVLLALPMSGISAATATTASDFTAPSGATNYAIEAINGGFKFVPAGTSTTTAGATAYYNHKLYEGKFSFKINTAALANNNEVGFVFGGMTFASKGFYKGFFAGSNFNIWGSDADGNAQSIGNYKRQVDLDTAVPGWKSGDTVKVSFAFSQAGAVRLWINDTLAYSIDVDDKEGTYEKKCVPFGGNLSIFNGAQNVELKVTDFTIEGGLELVNTGTKNATYDAKSYTFTIGGNKVVAYFSNRMIKDGYIVLNKNTNGGAGGPMFGVYHNGTASGGSHMSGRSFYILDSKNGSYRFIVSDHDATARNSITAENTDAYRANRFPDYNVGDNGARAGWMYGTGDGTSISYGNDTSVKVDFKIGDTTTTVSTGKISLTDKEPFGGQYYGVYSEAAANTTYTFYAVNNEKEAIGIDIDAGNLDLNALETGKTYEVKVKTFPEGSVINSGDTIKLGGTGISQVGNATLNNDGSYTVKFMANSANASALTASVDNHIFGTLTASVGVTATGTDVETGDATFIIGVGVVLVAILGSAIIVSKKRSIA